jgi:hypothetical protein
MLLPCRECGKKISTLAKTCPNCGTSKPIKIQKLPFNEQFKYFFSLPLHVQFIKATQASIGIMIIVIIAALILG